MKTAIIMGGGPAGLTAAYELAKNTDIHPILFEAESELGGISRTIAYKGNRIDFGGHRFFSKSDRVLKWWFSLLPLEPNAAKELLRTDPHAKAYLPSGEMPPDMEDPDGVMLVRPRKSRIYFMRRFFDYPLSLKPETILRLGLFQVGRIGLSYIRSVLFPIKEERNLEQFFINRFGRRFYRMFFKSYTEKVWGVSCSQISAEWGAQRIQGLSIWRAIVHFSRKYLGGKSTGAHKSTETSLIEQFFYPKLGPGHLWEKAGKAIEAAGGEIHRRHGVEEILWKGSRVHAVRVRNLDTNEVQEYAGDYFFSSLPVKDLVRSMGPEIPQNVQSVAEGLQYRDFITVGLLVKRMSVHDDTSPETAGPVSIPDTWIYIQEPDVRLGRLQIYNNWSPALVQAPDTVWLGLEYFCTEGDELWCMNDQDFLRFAAKELASIGIIEEKDVLDGCVLRLRKTYPAYWGAYERFSEIRAFLDPIENLYLIGRNGMHRYNNQDHSMLSAMTAVDNILAGRPGKDAIWDVNVSEEYHEVKTKLTAVENLTECYGSEQEPE